MNAFSFLAAALLALTAAIDARASCTDAAPPMTDAEVRKVDVDAGKLTLRHGPLENLKMGAMTMVFAVQDRASLATLSPGDKLCVAVERVDGALTVVGLRPAPLSP